MRTPGSLLASGRDADIFDYGPGLVLRRSRNGRSLTDEAAIMEYLGGHGYPVPRIDQISDDGCALVMERIDGPSMGAFVEKAPWALRRQARRLAALHRQLHEIPPADFLPAAPVGQGDQIVHLDLHPLNVIIGARGPVVIDWTNAARGDPAIDVGLAYVLVLAAQMPQNPIEAKLVGLGRRLFANSFISGFDRSAVQSRLRDVVAWKVQDPHMSARETQAMWQLVKRS